MAKIDEFMLCACILISFPPLSTAIDTLVANQTIKDGETIVSAGDNFELGFYSPGNSSNRYLGIWYKKKKPLGTFVWVSNKDTPLNDTSGVFKLSGDGRLLVFSGDNMIWSSNLTGFDRNLNPVAHLLDTGNLVVRDARSIDQENIIWQSNPSYDVCVRNGICGPYGTCNSNVSPVCSCLPGFKPKEARQWEIADWSGGCIRTYPLNCAGDAFLKVSSMKFPDPRFSWYNMSMTLRECETVCNRNCLCTAFGNSDIATGCLLWFGDLQDMRVTSGGRDLYVRITASELTGNASQTLDQDYTNESQKEPAELLSFSLSKVANSTNNFSINNKLGQGGFGPVFKVINLS
ncbi:G-type lectin S-receptor-like serine/threonine-protein kinase isoform X2 [Tanacetum coccineum]